MPRRKITHNRKYGPGPSFVIRSLSSLAWDPESLERERRERFESSPSPTDDKDSSDDDTEEWPEGMTPPRATKEMERHEASIPQYQWIDHQDEEREWLLAMTDRTLGGYEYDDYELEWRVYDGVKDRWKEQGIWREKWEDEFMTEWRTRTRLTLVPGLWPGPGPAAEPGPRVHATPRPRRLATLLPVPLPALRRARAHQGGAGPPSASKQLAQCHGRPQRPGVLQERVPSRPPST